MIYLTIICDEFFAMCLLNGLLAISGRVEQRTGSSGLFQRDKNKQYDAEYGI
jgi:hypothetical protein